MVFSPISSLSIVTAAVETKLTTLARVKSELAIVDTSNDTLLASKISEASSYIAGLVAPSLKRETVIETLRHDPRSCGVQYYPRLRLAKRPIFEIDNISLDGGSALSLDEYYHTDDADNWGGSVHRLSSSGEPTTWQFSKSIEIIYSSGYMLPGEVNRDLPLDIESACVELVAITWTTRGRDPGLRAKETVGVARFEYFDQTISTSGAKGIPPSVMAKLTRYLKPPIYV